MTYPEVSHAVPLRPGVATRRCCWLRHRPGSLACLLVAMLLGCTEKPDTEPFDPAEPGAVQPEGNGNLIGETAACRMLSEALEVAHADLNCDDPGPLSCPDLIRPYGSDPCERYRYDEGSVEACVEIVEGYDRCSDFDLTPCIVTAEIQASADCDGEDGAAGEGGGGGSGGTGGGAGAPPEGGAAGAAGAP